MQEKWVKIKEWPDYYISNNGKVKNTKGLVKLNVNKYRRNYVHVTNTKKYLFPKNLSVHRLVARYFIPNPENKPQVNHIDNNTQNNNVDNLEWVTPKENIAHMIKQGRQKYLRGEDCTRSILTEKDVRKIKELIKTKKYTYKQIAELIGTNYSCVAHINRGSRWGHVK